MHVGDTVKAFDPRTLGVVKTGRIVKTGRFHCTIDFGLTGSARVSLRDILEVTEPAARVERFEPEIPGVDF